MSKFGKVLVVVHTGLSFILVAMALALFTNQIRWNTPKTTGGARVEGIVEKRQKELNDYLSGGLGPAETNFKKQEGSVYNQESLIVGDRQFYAEELQHLRTGAADVAAKEARGVQRDGAGQVVLNPANQYRPVMIPLKDSMGNRLLSLQYYKDKNIQETTKYQDAADRLELAAKADKDATDKLTGPKGLHARIEHEKDKQKKLEAEKKLDVRPKYVNAAVELELLKSLQDRLDSRVKELQEALARRGIKPKTE